LKKVTVTFFTTTFSGARRSISVRALVRSLEGDSDDARNPMAAHCGGIAGDSPDGDLIDSPFGFGRDGRAA
jgi:hypothetical protein